MIACYKGHINIAQYLIANGAQVNRKSVKGLQLSDCFVFFIIFNMNSLFDEQVIQHYTIAPNREV